MLLAIGLESSTHSTKLFVVIKFEKYALYLANVSQANMILCA